MQYLHRRPTQQNEQMNEPGAQMNHLEWVEGFRFKQNLCF
jgi:hypothetical protein